MLQDLAFSPLQASATKPGEIHERDEPPLIPMPMVGIGQVGSE